MNSWIERYVVMPIIAVVAYGLLYGFYGLMALSVLGMLLSTFGGGSSFDLSNVRGYR